MADRNTKVVLMRFMKIFRSITFFSGVFFWFMSQSLTPHSASAEERAPASDTRVGLYFNYYLPSYTNTPLGIRRNCDCELGYQTGVLLQDRMFWRTWLNLHLYVLGAKPNLSHIPEQYGLRVEGQIRFRRVTLLVGHHAEWNIYQSSDFPIRSKDGNYISTGGLRETYAGVTWWF